MANSKDNTVPYDKREPPADRNRDVYRQDNWNVLDIGGIDDISVITSSWDGEPGIRLDLDGYVAESILTDVDGINSGENINISIHLEGSKAEKIVEKINSRLKTERN